MDTAHTTAMVGASLHGVFKEIINGTTNRGPDGVVFVKGDECGYCLVCDFPVVRFRDTLLKILQEDGGEHFFVVEERDAQLHIVAYTKKRVYEETATQFLSTQPSQDQKSEQDDSGECSIDNTENISERD